MSYLQTDLLFRLIIAHALADFILQPDQWVKHRNTQKIASKYLYFHTIVVGGLSYLAFGSFGAVWAVLFITLTHWALDLGKSYLKKDTLGIFLTDQVLHLLMIGVCWLAYTQQFSVFFNQLDARFHHPSTILVVMSYLLITIPLSIVISKVTKEWYLEVYGEKEDDSLKNAGKWIGIIERFLVLTFSIIGKFEAIGFLLAAKSVFRFNELKDPKDRKRTEYILIGTFISFSVSIALGLLVRHYLMRHG